MSLIAKKVSESVTIMTELVLPNHTNQLGKLLGGQLMHWIDICAAMSAGRHNRRVCVTASVDRIDFHHPISLGDPVTLMASVNRVFNTSMEIGVKVSCTCRLKVMGRVENEAIHCFGFCF